MRSCDALQSLLLLLLEGELLICAGCLHGLLNEDRVDLQRACVYSRKTHKSSVIDVATRQPPLPAKADLQTDREMMMRDCALNLAGPRLGPTRAPPLGGLGRIDKLV